MPAMIKALREYAAQLLAFALIASEKENAEYGAELTGLANELHRAEDLERASAELKETQISGGREP
jgi:hypothetical protein